MYICSFYSSLKASPISLCMYVLSTDLRDMGKMYKPDSLGQQERTASTTGPAFPSDWMHVAGWLLLYLSEHWNHMGHNAWFNIGSSA